MSNHEPIAPRLKQLFPMALLAACAVSVPYAYLLWGEASEYERPLWEPALFVLLGAPFVGYCSAAFLIWLLRHRLPQKAFLYWAGIAFAGSFIALAAVLIYFYFTSGLHLTWKRQLWNFGLAWLAICAYSSAFTAIYYYALIRRSAK